MIMFIGNPATVFAAAVVAAMFCAARLVFIYLERLDFTAYRFLRNIGAPEEECRAVY
jgi:hypothetical protein